MIILIAKRRMRPFSILYTLEYRIMIWTFATGQSMQFCNKTNKRMASSFVHLLHLPEAHYNSTNESTVYIFLIAIVQAISLHLVLSTPFLNISFYLLLPQNTTCLCVVVRHCLNIKTSHGIGSQLITRIYYT